jgi:type I restriction enzyme S subunit
MSNDELPESWIRCEIGEISPVVGGGTPPSKDPSNFVTPNGGTPWITPADLSRYREIYISHGARNLTTKGCANSAAKMLPKGALLFSSRAPVGYVAIASNPVCTNQGFKSFVLPHGFDSRFGYFYLRHIKPIAEAMATGTTFKELSGAAAAKLPFVIAPLAEQKRIADKLEAVLGRVDACRARLDRVPALLKRFRQSVLAAATSGKLTEEWREAAKLPISSAKDFLEQTLTLRREAWQKSAKGAAGRKYVEPEDMNSNDLPEIPKSWLWASADSVSSQVTDGEHIQPPYQSVGLPMLSAKHVRDGFVDAEGAGLIAKNAFEKALERCAPQNGDLLIVSVGATTGRVAIVENCEPFAIVRSVLLVKPLIPNRYFLRCLQSPWCFQRMTKASGASAQAHLYIKDTKRLPIPIPPLPEQQEIVRRVEALFAFADRIEARVASMQKTVERLTPATLAKAFRGELVPQDPNDEPASVLLDKLQATAGETTQKPKRRGRA